MDVAAAGELLVRGQAEVLGHALVPAGAHRFWLDGHGRGTECGHLDARPPGRGSGGRPASLQLAVQLIEGLARLGVGFQLLLLQFGFQVRTGSLPGSPQHGSRHRLRASGPRFDEQELFFNAHAARIHRPPMPADQSSMRQAPD